MGFTHLQIKQNPWLGGYRPQIPILPALCPQLNFLNPPPKKKKKQFLGTPLHHQEYSNCSWQPLVQHMLLLTA
jgi:hypothetical protein